MRHLALTLALAAVALPEARAQQKVDIRRAAAPNVSIRLSGAFTSLRITAWPADSIAITQQNRRADLAAHAVACADGVKPVATCEGNRRWVQLMFDAYLLMPIGPTFLDDEWLPEVDRALRWAGEPGHFIVTLADELYPRALLETADPPSLIYARGRIELLPPLPPGGARPARPQSADTLGTES